MAKKYKKYLAPAFVLLLAVFIRFYNYNNVPYTHDELSALSRLEFPDMSSLIENGIRPDGHPALVHLFLYAWTNIVGTSEEWVKLPFVLFGIISVLLTYKIGKKWFSESAGLFAALFMACTQFFIIYSHYARPYISGCFLALILVDSLLKILFDKQSRKSTYIIFAVSLALCALDHHMCALFAFISAVCGLLFIRRDILVPYFVSCVGAVLLYLPHLSITLSQFSIGGVGGWLTPPPQNFLLKFIFFLFHYSYPALGIIAGLILLSRFTGSKVKTDSPKIKIRILLFLVFVLSWLIPHLYSVFVNPLMQYSTLIFSAPCFLLLIFSFMRENNPVLKWSSLFLMSGVLFFTLAKDRKYFQLNFRQGFEEFVLSVNHFQKTYPDKKVLAVVKAENWFIDFYKNKYGVEADFICQPNDYIYSSTDLKPKLDSAKADIVLVGNMEPSQIYQVQNYYPKLVKYDFGYTYELMVFCNDCEAAEVSGPRVKKSLELNLNAVDSFRYNKSKIITDTINKSLALKIDESDEYPLEISSKMNEWTPVAGNHFLVEVTVNNTDSLNALICTTINNSDSTIYFSASHLQGYLINGKKITKAFHSAFVQGNFENMKNETLKVFLWNKDHYSFNVYTFKLSLIDLNPYRYGLLEKIN